MMKRVLSVVLSLLMLCTMLFATGVFVSAEGTEDEKMIISAVPRSTKAEQGGTVTFDFRVDNNLGSVALRADFKYDPEILLNPDVVEGPLAKEWGNNFQHTVGGLMEEDGKNFVFWAGQDNEYDNGVWASVTFDVADDARLGNITLDLSETIVAGWIIPVGGEFPAGSVAFVNGTVEVIAPCDHANAVWRVQKEATCNAEGLEEQYCANCDKVISTRSIAMTPHVISSPISSQPATCTAVGNAIGTCDICGTFALVELPMIPHTPGDWETQTAPTETTDGLAVKKCTVCQSVLETKTIPSQAHEHTEGEWTVTTPATCTATGVETLLCATCGEPIRTRDIDMLPHSFGAWTVTTPATCTEAGVETRTCTVCETETETRPIAALGHSFGEWTVTTPATCTEAGVETRTCTICETETETHPIAALGHSFGAWTVTTPATCTEAGVETRTCTICETESETRPIAALGHSFGEWTVTTPATCTAAGVETRTCTVCETETETRPIAQLAHNYQWVRTTEPTCSAAGVEKYRCSVCGDVADTREVAKLDHTFGEWEFSVMPTLYSEGELARVCSVCDESETQVFPPCTFDEENQIIVVPLDEGMFQEGDEMIVRVPENATVADVLKGLLSNYKVLDISFINFDEEQIKPDGQIGYSLRIPQDYDLSKVKVYQIVDGQAVEVTGLEIEDDLAIFEAEAGGVFVIGETVEAPEEPVKEPTEKPSDPITGDNFPVVPLAIFAVVSLAAVVLLKVKKKTV